MRVRSGGTRRYGAAKSASFMHGMSSTKSALGLVNHSALQNESMPNLAWSQNSFLLQNELSAKSKVTSLKNAFVVQKQRER